MITSTMSLKFRSFCNVHVLFLLIMSIQTEEPSHVNIVVSTSNGAVHTNSTVYLACVASGSIVPSISWTKSHITNITNSTSCRHTVYEHTILTPQNLKFTESVLELNYVKPEDSGVYVCTANNGAPSISVSATTTLRVLSVLSPRTTDEETPMTNPDTFLPLSISLLLVLVLFVFSFALGGILRLYMKRKVRDRANEPSPVYYEDIEAFQVTRYRKSNETGNHTFTKEFVTADNPAYSTTLQLSNNPTHTTDFKLDHNSAYTCTLDEIELHSNSAYIVKTQVT